MSSRLPTILTASILLLLAGCEGCEPIGVTFIETEDDDDVTDSPDDDDTTEEPEEEPPVVQVEHVDPPPGDSTAGLLNVGFSVSDLDSSSVSLLVDWSPDGADGVFAPASLFDEASNEVAVDVAAPPMVGETGAFAWDTETDVPFSVAGAALRLCPVDAEGNEGECVFVEELVVVNQATTWPGAFCQPGHVEGTDWVGGQALVPLSDGECLNFVSHDPPQPDDYAARFLVVLVNPNADDVGFTISPSAALATDSAAPPEDDPDPPAPEESDDDAEPRDDDECEPDLDEADLHLSTLPFAFRETLDSPARTQRGATLRALGEHVAVYVDDETPIDFDADCDDPDNPLIPDPNPAFGFDNCDLEEVVEVFDLNVYPTVTWTFGAPSDVDCDDRVTVYLTHRVNRLTLTDGDPSNDSFIIKAFAEPEIDLWAQNLASNPDSNEQEILYVYAPDPAGLWGNETVPLDAYLDYELAGQMGRALHELVSYANHVGVPDLLSPNNPPTGEPEEDWLLDALGLLAADLSGFGAIAWQDAWIYLDRPHLLTLRQANTLGDFQDRGGQYLFARYLLDAFGVETISALALDEATGPSSLEEATGMSFDDLVLDWATALAVSGRLNEAGGQLVSDDVVPNFATSTTVAVPVSPSEGDLVGADGFQQGFNLRGANLTFTGGSDPAGPTELEELRALTANVDPLVYHPQTDLFGEIAGAYGVAVVLVSGLEQPTNHLLIETVGGVDLVARVVRIDDEQPTARRLVLEDVDGAALLTVRDLGAVPLDGSETRVIGRIDPPETISLAVSPPPDVPGTPLTLVPGVLEDTDRFGLSLSAVTTLGVMVDRRYSDLFGGAALADPFVAVVPASDLPDAWDYSMWDMGPSPSDGPCFDPTLYLYPSVMPDFIAAQANLAADPTVDWSWEPVLWWAPELETDPEPPLECAIDLDQDDVPDALESFPATLHAQVIQRQAENLADDPSFYEDPWSLMAAYQAVDLSQPFWGAEFIDADSNEVPDDAFVTSYPALGLGGRAVEGGEEAVWYGTLPPGDYVLVVGGAGGSVGPYDLSVRTLTP